MRKGVLKVCSKFTGEHPCRSTIFNKLLCNFIEIALRHWRSPPNLLHIFRTPFSRNTSEWLLLELAEIYIGFKETEEIDHIYEKIREMVDERFRSVCQS